MAGFDVQTITAAGASLIAAATAQNKLILDGCDATTAVLTREQAIAISSRPSNPGSNTTDVALAGSTDNHVYAYAEFIRGSSTGGEFNTFYLYGHSQSSPSDIRVIAVVSAAATTHLPTSLDTFNRSEIQFELTFSATDEVVEVASTSMYTTRGEFLLLKNRTVTTHAEGETAVGDNQTIYGAKAFADGIQLAVLSGIGDDPVEFASSIEGNIVPSDDNEYTIGDSTHCYRNVNSASIHVDGISSKSPGAIDLGSSLVPDTDGALDLGSPDYNFRNVYTHKIVGNNMPGGMLDIAAYDITADDDNAGVLICGRGSDDFPFVNIYYNSATLGEGASLVFKNGALYCDYATNGPYLGTSAEPWAEAWLSQLDTAAIRIFGSATSITTDSLIPSGSATYLGLPQLPFADINATSIYGLDFLPLDNTADIGNSDNKFRKLYAKELHGVIPSPSTYLDEPEVGAIFFAGITVAGAVAVNAGATAKVGLPLSSGGSNVTAIGTVTWDMQTNKFTSLASFSTSTGSYKLLCGVNKSSTDTYCCALVIRVE